jgi:hypothetical protein
MKHFFISLLIICLSAPVSAGTSQTDIQQLRSELLSLLKRVESLESENKSLKDSITEGATSTNHRSDGVATVAKTSWTDTIKVKGDLRYRYENIDAERSDTRERYRVRARAEITATPTDNLEVGLGVASGGGDPGSTNQTLGGAGSTKDIRLDLAYVKWQAKPGLKITAGKMKNTYRRAGGNGLIWDGDYRPEGVTVAYTNGDFFFDTALHFLESDSRRGNEAIVYGLQTGFKGNIGVAKLLAGIGYYDIGTSDHTVFYGDADDFFGNSFTCVDPATSTGCTYSNDYDELELFAELSTTVADKPLKVFANFVQNQAASDLDTAWAFGVMLGKASNPNTWEIGYTYQDVEADSIFGLLTDSDFVGGGTDSKGHVIKGAWAVNKKWKLSLTYFDTERNQDIGLTEDYRRLMLDTAFKF